MTTLWYIWKARNDAHFKNKKWSILQVHFAVAADMRLATSKTSTNAEDSHQNPENITPNTATIREQKDYLQQNDRTNDQNLGHTHWNVSFSFAGNDEEESKQKPDNDPTRSTPLQSPIASYPVGHKMLHRCIYCSRFYFAGSKNSGTRDLHHQLSSKCSFDYLCQSKNEELRLCHYGGSGVPSSWSSATQGFTGAIALLLVG